jgi:intein/homing endonuclease
MNREIAILLALLLSDGSVYYDRSKRTFCIQFTNKNKALRDRFKKSVAKCFGKINFRDNNCTNAISTRFFSKKIAEALLEYTNSFQTHNAKIPKEIFTSKENAAAFLRAYSSGDGCIYKDKSHRNGVVEIACKPLSFRKQLKDLFAVLGIHARIISKGIRIDRKGEVLKFSKIVRFLPESTVTETRSSNYGRSKNEILDSCCSYS